MRSKAQAQALRALVARYMHMCRGVPQRGAVTGAEGVGSKVHAQVSRHSAARCRLRCSKSFAARCLNYSLTAPHAVLP